MVNVEMNEKDAFKIKMTHIVAQMHLRLGK
jgi:hypothetical protein